MAKRIYLDHAAATPLRREVKKAMDRFWDIDFGNAGAIHAEGVTAKKAIVASREIVAKALKARSDEIIFNSGGTESNSLAILGFLNKLNEQGRQFEDMHLITSTFEHPSVLQCFKYFEKKGAQVNYTNINQEGIVDINHLKEILTPKTVLVSIMFVNNEIGTIQPISEIAKLINGFKKRKPQQDNLPVFHSDAAQALLFLPINTKKLNIDMMSFDAQKIYGPKGVGALYIKKGVEINPLITGGSQEKGLRPGTENTPLIVGFAKALELAELEKEKESQRLTKLRDYFITETLKKIPGTKLNGNLDQRLCNNVNIFFPEKNNEFMVIQLDKKGVACSTKSACLTGKDSYVVDSIGDGENRGKGSIRFTMGKSTTKKNIDYLIKSLIEICSPSN
ncbi:MAG: cysteine desulfurase family protein [Patescibacteria group bacterium]|nr:cysteine desulfurase family protein [Patescibacteria group bacterium]